MTFFDSFLDQININIIQHVTKLISILVQAWGPSCGPKNVKLKPESNFHLSPKYLCSQNIDVYAHKI